MNKIKLLILFLLSVYFSFGQSDGQLWTEINLSKKINDVKFSFAQNLRLNNNLASLDKYFSEVGLEYDFKIFDFGIDYRYSQNYLPEVNGTYANHRICLNLSFNEKFNNIKFSNRLRYQQKFDFLKSNSSYIRNKIKAQIKSNENFEPFGSFEVFYRLNEVQNFNKFRISFGNDFILNKNNELSVYYIYDHEFYTGFESNHIIGFGYAYKFD